MKGAEAELSEENLVGTRFGWRSVVHAGLYMLGPAFVIVAIQVFEGNIELANKLGLQRMRTQRMLKRTLFTLFFGNETSSEALRSFGVIKEKHEGFQRRRGFLGPNYRSRLNGISSQLDDVRYNLDDVLATSDWDDLGEKWIRLDTSDIGQELHGDDPDL